MSDPSVRRAARRLFPSGPSRRLVGVFILFVFLPGAFLAVFALRVLRQEGQIVRQRAREDMDRAAAEIERDMASESNRWTDTARFVVSRGFPLAVASLPETLSQAFAAPGGGVLLSATAEGIEVFPPGAVLYLPPGSAAAVQNPRSDGPPGLAAAESMELVRKDLPRAVRAYRALLSSSGPASRPLVLQRLGRTFRKAGRLDEAERAYRDMLGLSRTWIGELPSDLIARSELLALLVEKGDRTALGEAALDLYRDLVSGSWLLDEPRYLYYADTARRECQDAGVDVTELEGFRASEKRKLALSRAVAASETDPRSILPGEGDAFLVLRNDEPSAAVIISAAALETGWWPRLLSGRGIELGAALTAPDGSVVFGSTPPEPQSLAVNRDIRMGEAELRLRIWPARPETIDAEIAQRRRLSLSLLGFVILLLLFGAYSTIRIVRRELEIARLRTDFVSTVSHEFRSPLTGIRQLAGMLFDGRVADPAKKKEYFGLIVQESDRLGRLVENVLDFSRMEEGRKEYRFEPLDLGPWLRTLAAGFASERPSAGTVIDADVPNGLPVISADREALGSAVRNLLDNAVKYSPGEETVWLEARGEGGQVRISVRDKGIGIAESDRKHIFDRFYRAGGETSKRVKGAGLGLSLVQHIVRAHGGTVECRSRVGEGSIFTLRIPVIPARGGE
jgi:signal transduction histidine kinase